MVNQKKILQFSIGLTLIGLMIFSTGFATNTALAATKNPTSTTISPSTVSTSPGLSGNLQVKVQDTGSPGPTYAVRGNVTWSDGGAGGTFSSGGTCTLATIGSATSVCTITYTAPSTPNTKVTITATYSGDGAHNPSSGTATVNVGSSKHPTITSLSPSSVITHVGMSGNFQVRVVDNNSPGPTTPVTGTVTWSDGGAGGTFSSGGSCTLAQNGIGSQCTITYTAPSTPGIVTVTATYSGDVTHNPSSATATVTVQANP